MRGHDEQLAFTVAASPMRVCALSVSKRSVLPDGSAAAQLPDMQSCFFSGSKGWSGKGHHDQWALQYESIKQSWKIADLTAPQALQSNIAHKNFVLIIMPAVKWSPGSNHLGTVFPAQS